MYTDSLLGVPNVSPSLFRTLFCVALSNSFSSLDDFISDDQIGSPVATSSPTETSSQFNRPPKLDHKKNHKLKTLVVNCDGLSNKLPHLESLINAHHPDIIIGTESHLKSSIFTSEITPPGFVTYRKDRVQGNKDGVFIMIKDNVIATECNIIKTDSELLWIEIHIQDQALIIEIHITGPGVNN